MHTRTLDSVKPSPLFGFLAQGSFEITATRQPPYDSVDGLVLARTSFVKAFRGDLQANSSVEMLSAGTPTQGSAAYVALERVSGWLGGRQGNFVLTHLGVMNRGDASLSLAVVPDSGTGGLTGLLGQMTIEVRDGVHYYRFEYSLGT
jgi:hypothetical protein